MPLEVDETNVPHGFSRISRFTSAASSSRKCGVRRMSGLLPRAPVELASAELLHRDLRSAAPAGQPGALVDPVPVGLAAERLAEGLAVESVHGQHLPGLHGD